MSKNSLLNLQRHTKIPITNAHCRAMAPPPSLKLKTPLGRDAKERDAKERDANAYHCSFCGGLCLSLSLVCAFQEGCTSHKSERNNIRATIQAMLTTVAADRMCPMGRWTSTRSPSPAAIPLFDVAQQARACEEVFAKSDN